LALGVPVARLGVDAAVLYADIMLPLDGMGVPFHIEPEVGPIVERPVRTTGDVAALRVVDADEATPYLFTAIRELRRSLPAEVALIGFAGAPFTLASYLIEGRPSRDLARTKALLFGDPVLWDRLMSTLTEVLVRSLNEQVDSGVDVIQLFDSWAGALSPERQSAIAGRLGVWEGPAAEPPGERPLVLVAPLLGVDPRPASPTAAAPLPSRLLPTT